MKKILLLTTLLSLWAINSSATDIDFKYKIKFSFNFDNLESSDPWERTRTRLGIKLAPELGVMFDKKHSVMVGADLIQNFGEKVLSAADYILYYKFNSSVFDAYAGAFSIDNTIGDYPMSFFSEEYRFYNPIVEGALMQYRNKKKTGYVELWADWYGMDEKERIDEFMIVASSRYDFADKLLFVGGNVLLNHFKNDLYLKDSYLLERLQYHFYVGTDVKKIVPFFNELSLKVGTLSSRERKRIEKTETNWTNSPGWQAEITALFKGFGVKNTTFFGDSQMIYANQYGTSFYPGSPFYRTELYNRTELSYQYKKKFFSVKANLIFHYHDGVKKFANQQLIQLNLNIEDMFTRRKRNL